MKKLKKDLQAVSKELENLTKKTKELTNKLKTLAAARLEKAKATVTPHMAAHQVAAGLKSLAKTMGKMTKAVEKFEKDQVAKTRKSKKAVKARAKTRVKAEAKAGAKTKAKAGAKARAAKKAPAKKKTVKPTATDQVLKAIKGSKKGVGVPTLAKKTGHDERKVRNIVARAFRLGKIKRVGRGTYVGA